YSLSFPKSTPVFNAPSEFNLPDPPVSISPHSFNLPSPYTCPPHFQHLSPPLSIFLCGWVPAAELVGLVAGVMAWLSGVACYQGGCRAARTIGAERLRLTAGHLSRAISVEAEALLPLSAPLIVKINGNQSPHSTLLSPLFTSLPPTLTLSYPCLSLLPIYLFEFSPVVLLQLSG
ncbi:hypothetical protein GOODEAATRI_016767, partial [Goodea atripinnis]